jgi:hypothetical protein
MDIRLQPPRERTVRRSVVLYSATQPASTSMASMRSRAWRSGVVIVRSSGRGGLGTVCPSRQ